MALAVAKSGLFGVKTADQAMALMLIAQAEGLHPAIAARDYHVINGRPTLKADAMLARFQTAGGSVRWGEYTDRRVVGTFSHPQGGSVDVAWTVEMATSAGLTKNPTWKSYPRQMLRARCISEGIRTVFPGVVVGTYTPEEAEDMVTLQAPPPSAPRDMGPVVEVADFAAVMRQIDAAQTVEELNALRPAIRTLNPDVRAEATDAAKQRAQQIRDNLGGPETSDDPI
jgi:hypothetical protein